MSVASQSEASVPFVDVGASIDGLREAILADVAALFESGAFTNGPEVEEFERAFATYCRTAHCVGVSNGLDALRLALLAAGIQDGDEVLVPANTFVATFAAIRQAGGRPVPVDASERDYNIDPVLAEQAIKSGTRFLVPVHLYGQLADMRALTEIAERRDLGVIEDAAQAHGATRDGFRAGSGGLAGTFSFYPSKNLGAAGDAGAIVTDNGELAPRLRALREHGQKTKYVHEAEGYTARLDTLQAIVLLHKLPRLDRWNEERRSAARFYGEALDGLGDLRLPPVPEGSNPVWHLYVVRTEDPDRLAAHLAGRGISTGRHYPQPPHLSSAFSWLGYSRGAFPVTEDLADHGLSLPIFPGITEEQLEAVRAAVAEHFERG